VLDNIEPADFSDEQSERRGATRTGKRRSGRPGPGSDALDGNGAAPAAEAGPSDWQDSEWGPAEPPPPPEETSWGWAEGEPQSAGSAARGGGDGAAQPSAAWDEELERRERSRRRPPREPGADAYGEEDEELYDEDDEEYDEDDGAEASDRQPGGSEPDIALLSPAELDRLLPVVPFSAQAAFFNGGAAQAVQRWGASLALTLLLSKAALLAATSLTWPLW
jgi:hypothetical protein